MGQDPDPREGELKLLVNGQSCFAMDGQHRLLGLTEGPVNTERSADAVPDNRAVRRVAARRAKESGKAARAPRPKR